MTININYFLYVQSTGPHQTTICTFIMFLQVFIAANVCNAVTVMLHDT